MKIQVAQGVLTKTDKAGRKVNVEHIDVPEYNDCCKLDCCTGGVFTKDIATGDSVVIYVENGVLKQDTVANFETAVKSYQ